MPLDFPPITIWIHGTNLSELVIKPLRGITEKAFHKFFHCEPGLNLASTLSNEFHHAKITQTLVKADPELFPLDTLYLFGWSGKLSSEERKKAAVQLYEELQHLTKEFKSNYGRPPFLRLITHSHGGNVALNLASINSKANALNIDELILLACPVQQETENFIKAPLFKNIYSLHSHWDVLQVLDPQGLPEFGQAIKQFFQKGSIESLKDAFKQFEEQTFFSKRHFLPNKNLIQANLRKNNRNLLHVEFLLSTFIEKLPGILEEIKTKPRTNREKDWVIEFN